MFEHSIPVPRLYRAASKIIENVSKKEDSVKNLVYQAKHPNKKALYALVIEALKRNKQLDFLLKRTKLSEKEPRFNVWLSKVLITELLWGKKRLAGDSKPVKTILGYEQVLKAHQSDIHEDNTKTNKVLRPRFVRVNTILATVQEAVEGFRDDGWTLVHHTDIKNYADFLQKVTSLSECEFMIDIHIPELLVFPPNTEFYAHNAYKSGLIVLQDKASCLPAHLLNPADGSISLDMCAAPGMKTSHLASKINNNGKVYAVDLDAKRLKTLEGLMEKTGATCVKVINKDVLQITDNDCPNVEYILVDPSCSGSGIVDRIDLVETTVKDDKRIQKLKGFQIMILKHALRKFPKAKRVVYSTCSIYPEENEEVVQEVLSQTAYFKLVDASKLLKASWINYGSEKYGEIAKYCLYSRPDQDLTNGFFLAIFERLKDGEENKYFVQNKEYQNVKETIVGQDKNDVHESRGGTKLKKNKNKKSEVSELETTTNKRTSKMSHMKIHENDETKDVGKINDNNPDDMIQFENNKKRKKNIDNDSDDMTQFKNDKKKKKKSKNEDFDNVSDLRDAKSGDLEIPVMDDANTLQSKKKKKKNKSKERVKIEECRIEDNEEKINETNIMDAEHITKQKKKKKIALVEDLLRDDLIKEENNFDGDCPKKKKKKKKKSKMDLEAEEVDILNIKNVEHRQNQEDISGTNCNTKSDLHKKKIRKHKHNTVKNC